MVKKRLLLFIGLMLFLGIITFQNANAQCNTIDFKASKTEGCPLLIVEFTTIGTSSAAGTKFQWDFGNGYINGTDTITSAFSNPGSYTIKMQATLSGSSTPCPVIVKDSFITVFPVPAPVMSFDTIGHCGGTKVVLIDITSGSVSRDWVVNNKISTSKTDTVVFPASGSYTVSLASTNQFGCEGFASKVVQIVDFPYPNAFWTVSNSSKEYLFKVKDSSVYKYYTWNFGDSSKTESGYHVSHVFAQNKKYAIKLLVTNQYGCISEDDSTIDITNSGINPALCSGIYNLDVYPNPFGDKTLINFTLPQTSHVLISLMDIKGNVLFILDKTLNSGPNQIEIKASEMGLSPGTYFVNMMVNDVVISKKIIELR